MPSASLAEWQRVLDGTGALLRRRLADALADATRHGSRVWAVDLSAGTGGSAPKFYVVAEPHVFAAACTRVARHRHAYEIVEARHGCYAYFDLDAKAMSLDYLELAGGNAANR